MIDEKESLTCQCCGVTQAENDEVEEIEPGLVLCSTCEVEEYAQCLVCKRYMSRDSARNHRHLFETEHGEWYGTGGSDMGESEYEEVRVSLHALLDQMGKEFAQDLARTIEGGHMCYDRLHTVTGLVLGSTLIFCYLDGEDDTQHFHASYGDELYQVFDAYELQEDADEYPFSYGFWWLFGLGEDTPEENTRTVGWIQQWLLQQERSIPSSTP